MSSYQVCKRTLRFPKLGGFEDPDSPGPGHYQLDSSSFVKAANAANQPTAAFGSNDRLSAFDAEALSRWSFANNGRIYIPAKMSTTAKFHAKVPAVNTTGGASRSVASETAAPAAAAPASPVAEALSSTDGSGGVVLDTRTVLTQKQAARNSKKESQQWTSDVQALDQFVLPIRKSALWKAANAQTGTNWLRKTVAEGKKGEGGEGQDMRDEME